MTKNFKKFAALGLSVSALACMAVAVGCNKDPETVTYTITVDLPEGATAPSDWKLQYCGTSAGAVCTEVAINAEGVASFTTEALNEVYDLHVLNAGYYQQAEDVSTVVGTTAYTITMNSLLVDLESYNSLDAGEDCYYGLTVANDFTITFTAYTDKISLKYFEGADISLVYDNVESYVAELELNAGSYVFQAYYDDAEGTQTLYAEWADGSLAAPIAIGGEEYTQPETYTSPVGTTYYKYDNYSNGGTWSVATTASNCTVKLMESSWNDETSTFDWVAVEGALEDWGAQTNFYVMVTVTGTEEASWTLTFTLPPEGSQDNPKVINQPTTLTNIVINPGEGYYLSLQQKLQFTVPTGVTAYIASMMGMPEQVQAGNVVAFTDYSMPWVTEKSVSLVNTGATAVTITELTFTEYEAPEGSTYQTAFTLSLTEANTATAGDYNNGVYFAFVNEDSQAGTLTFTAANGETVVFSCQAGGWGVSPDAPVEAAGITVTSADYMIYVYVIFDSTSASSGTVSFTATFTPAA